MHNKLYFTKDGPDAFRFTFNTDNGTIKGRVSVARASRAPDQRDDSEKRAALQKKLAALAKEFIEAVTPGGADA